MKWLWWGGCRDREKCQRVRRDIVLSTRNKQVYCRQCDLTDFDSVRQFVSKIYKGLDSAVSPHSAIYETLQ